MFKLPFLIFCHFRLDKNTFSSLNYLSCKANLMFGQITESWPSCYFAGIDSLRLFRRRRWWPTVRTSASPTRTASPTATRTTPPTTSTSCGFAIPPPTTGSWTKTGPQRKLQLCATKSNRGFSLIWQILTTKMSYEIYKFTFDFYVCRYIGYIDLNIYIATIANILAGTFSKSL